MIKTKAIKKIAASILALTMSVGITMSATAAGDSASVCGTSSCVHVGCTNLVDVRHTAYTHKYTDNNGYMATCRVEVTVNTYQTTCGKCGKYLSSNTVNIESHGSCGK